jgi:tetratricopeptide (TPR) repeat protein
MGFDPQAHSWLGDGATFEVFIDGERVFLEHVDQAMALEGWHRRAVDLSSWAGEQVELSLAVTPGPQADPAGDWAGWGEPWVVDARWPELEALNAAGRAKEAWEEAGMTAESFILWGEAARREEQFDEALQWYERAMQLEPALGDPSYYVGRLRENQEQWFEALDAYGRALNAENLRTVGRSSPLYRMGLIYQRHLEPPRLEEAMIAYETALQVDQFTSQEQGVEWVHARLGQVYYSLDGDFESAEREILLALEMAPNQRWLYVLAGDLYVRVGQKLNAQDMYEQALRISPGFEAAQGRLEAVRGGR